MDVADAMTPREELVTVRLPGGRADALRYLQEHGFSSVPVETQADGVRRYRGLVSRQDMIHNPDEDQLALLLREVEPVTPETTMRAAIDRMLAGERRLPVVDGDQLTGILTVTDAIRAVAREQLTTEGTCEAVATDRVSTVYTETPLVVADRQLGLNRESYAVCLDSQGDQAGVLTETDIVEVVRIVEGEAEIGNSMADMDDEWKWESVKGVGGRYLPTRNVEIPTEPVERFMTTDVETVIGSRSVPDAARAMLRADVEQLPLMDGGELVGVVRDADLLEAITDG